MKQKTSRPVAQKRSRSQKRSIRGKNQRRRIVPRSAEDLFAQPEEFQTDWEDMLRVIKKMRTDGTSLRSAAKLEGVNPRTVSRLAGRALRRRSNRSYSVTHRDSLLRVMLLPTSRGLQEIALRNSYQASLLGQYWAALQKYSSTGDATGLKKFRNNRIKDVYGVEYPLITDLEEEKRLGSAGVLSFESLYGRAA